MFGGVIENFLLLLSSGVSRRPAGSVVAIVASVDIARAGGGCEAASRSERAFDRRRRSEVGSSSIT